MQGSEKRMLAERLGALADAMGGKLPQTEKGMQIWLEAIEDLPGWAVLQSVTNWMRHSDRFPTPFALRKAALDLIETEQERDAERNAREMPTVSQVINADPVRAEQFDRYREMVRATTPTDPKAWIYPHIADYATRGNYSRMKVREFLHREPTEEDIRQAKEKIAAMNRLAFMRPSASEFFT